MALIDPDGLYRGSRLRRCSDRARLYWPYLFLAADGFGRMELDYASLAARLFLGFQNPPAEEEFWSVIEEYRVNHLAFVYRACGSVWCQWVCKPNCLPRYKTAEDRKSPLPPQREYESWISNYKTEPNRLPKFVVNLPKIDETLTKTPPSPTPSPQAFSGKGGAGGDPLPEDAFLEFHERYPKETKIHAGEVSEAFEVHIRGAVDPAREFRELMAGVDRLSASGTPARYMPTAARFIKDGRYRERWEPERDNGGISQGLMEKLKTNMETKGLKR